MTGKSGEDDSVDTEVVFEDAGSESAASADLTTAGSLSDVDLADLIEEVPEAQPGKQRPAAQPKAGAAQSVAAGPPKTQPAPPKAKPSAALAELGKLFDFSGQLASTARQLVEKAFKGIDTADSEQRRKAKVSLKEATLQFAEEAMGKGTLDLAQAKQLVAMVNAFAQMLVIARANAK